MTAPLCGSVSMPPEAIDGDPMEQLGADPLGAGQLQVAAPITSSAIDSPPDAEPVIPASTLTATASETRTCRLTRKTPPWIAWKPGKVLTTLPNPTSEAVLKIASSGPRRGRRERRRKAASPPRGRRPPARPRSPKAAPRSATRSRPRPGRSRRESRDSATPAGTRSRPTTGPAQDEIPSSTTPSGRRAARRCRGGRPGPRAR